MIVNAQVTRNKNENAASMIRKFSRKVRGTGTLQAVRGKRYFKRADSSLRKKLRALDRMTKRKHYARLRKLGKIS